MNYIKHLAGFFERVAADERLNPTHISMYVSLFQFWNASRFQNPISISRSELMRISKISAKATYHKCIRELNDFGYLQYRPSYNPFKGSLVYLYNFQAAGEQAVATLHTKKDTGIEQAQEPYINNSNIVNKTSANGNTLTQKNEIQKLKAASPSPLGEGRGEVGVGGEVKRTPRENFTPPDLPQVREYFASKKYPAREAEKFYKYYQSNGWLVGGKTTMQDWNASADKWMLNEKNFSKGKTDKPTAKHLHTTQQKNYAEPL